MQKLKLSEWAYVAEIIASIVIVASLAYIGMEVNQNTKALQTESYQTMTGILVDLDVAQASSEDLNRIIMLAEASPSDVTVEEWERFTHIAFARYGLWEYLFLSYQDDSISEAQWSTFEPFLRGFACKRGYKQFWEEKISAFSVTFQEYFESSVIQVLYQSAPKVSREYGPVNGCFWPDAAGRNAEYRCNLVTASGNSGRFFSRDLSGTPRDLS